MSERLKNEEEPIYSHNVEIPQIHKTFSQLHKSPSAVAIEYLQSQTTYDENGMPRWPDCLGVNVDGTIVVTDFSPNGLARTLRTRDFDRKVKGQAAPRLVQRADDILNFVGEILGPNILSEKEYEPWKAKREIFRELLEHSTSPEIYRRAAEHTCDTIDKLLGDKNRGRIQNLTSLLGILGKEGILEDWGAQLLTTSILGIDINDKLVGNVKRMTANIKKALLPGGNKEKLSKEIQKEYGPIKKHVEDIYNLVKNGGTHNSGLGRMLEAMLDSGKELPELDELNPQVAIAVFAGLDTTAFAAVAALTHLADQDNQEAIFAEIKKKEPHQITEPVLAGECQNTWAYVQESLRFGIGSQQTVREVNYVAAQDITLDPNGNKIQAGTKITVSYRAAMLNPNYWQSTDHLNSNYDTMKFNRQRFMHLRPADNNTIRTAINLSGKEYIGDLPFSTGLRVCPGARVATEALLVLTAMFASRYEVIAAKTQTVRPKHLTFALPLPGTGIEIKRRK